MRFKFPYLEEEYDNAPLLLKWIIQDVETIAERFGKDIVLTRILDPVKGESGVHRDYRAADLRSQYLGVMKYSPEEIEIILNEINEKYYRNDGMPTIIHHQFRGGPYHLHLQISDKTKTYMKGK